jgi:4-hydroxy-3-methylbut-2-enyl diphosphate reductase
VKLVVLAPLRTEALAVRSALPGVKVKRTGMGRATNHVADADAVGIAGLCGAVAPELRTGDVVLATELRSDAHAPIPCPGSGLLAEPLRRLRLRTHAGPVQTSPRILGPDEREALRATGVVAVDMESALLAEAVGDRPLAVLRVVVDTADRRLLSPRTIVSGARALWTLRRASEAFVEWVEAYVLVPAAAGDTLAPV